jgi:hypothetical protein
MLKVWIGKDGGSIIVSKSDPQHELMQELGFKLAVGVKYGSLNRIDPGDYYMYRAADYLGNDSIYRCMRINDGTDEKFIALKKHRQSRAREKASNKIVVSLQEPFNIANVDKQYLACTACKRIFRKGHNNRHQYTITFNRGDINNVEWSYNNIVCCDKNYIVGNHLSEEGRSLVFCNADPSTRVFYWGNTNEPYSSHEQLIVDYLEGKKEAKKIERTNG